MDYQSNDIKFTLLRGEEEIALTPCPIRGYCDLPGGSRLRVKGKMLRTISGANYNWAAVGFPISHSWEPTVNLEFPEGFTLEWLGWHSPPRLPRVNQDGAWLSYGGSLVDCPFLITSSTPPVDLSFRKEREELFERLQLQGEVYQGHLKVSLINFPAPDFENFEIWKVWKIKKESPLAKLCYYPNRPVVLFNHGCFVQAVVGLDYRRLVLVGEEGLTVSSPDHPLETIHLAGPGWYLLEHPAPSRNGGD